MAKHGGYGFGGGMGGMNMQSLMQQARKMQEQMAKAQAELDEKEFVGNAGNGLVTVTVNGHGALRAVTVKPEAMDPDDPEMLEDLIMAAINDGYKKADEVYKEKMAPFAGLGGMM